MLLFLIKTENTVTRLKNMINIDKHEQTKYKTRDKNKNDARAIGSEGKRKKIIHKFRRSVFWQSLAVSRSHRLKTNDNLM